MNELITMYNQQLVTSSRKVAMVFGKEHKHVLEAIRNISTQISTAEFSALFYESHYKASNGKMNVEFLMNRDGFSLLVMGFTGKEALAWKIKYINAFNNMERKLQEQNTDSYMINDPVERAKKWIQEEEKRKALATTVSQLECKIESDAPKVAYANFCATSPDMFTVRKFATELQSDGVEVSETALRAWLVENHYIYNDGWTDKKGKYHNNYRIYATYSKKGWFAEKPYPIASNNADGPHISYTVYITTLGKQKLLQRLRNDFCKQAQRQLILEV